MSNGKRSSCVAVRKGIFEKRKINNVTRYFMREKKIDFELQIARYFSNTVGCIVARLQNHQSCTILHNESYTMLHNVQISLMLLALETS